MTYSNKDEEDDVKQIPKFMCRANDRKRTLWDLFIMVFATVNIYTIPVEIAFQPKFMEHWLFLVFNIFIDTTFFIDIVINFRTTYTDKATDIEVWC